MAPTQAGGDRLHGLDAFRGCALFLGVVEHSAMAYMLPPSWIVINSQTSGVAGALFFFIHMFRMTAFYVVAGLFAHLMIQRRGWVGFVKDRSSRIAGVLFAMWPVVCAAIIGVTVFNAAIHKGGGNEGPPPPPLTLGTVPLTHLWFLWVLLILYAVMLAVRAVLSLDRSGGFVRTADRAADLLIGWWSPVLLAIPLALVFYLTPDWIPFLTIPSPESGLVPNAQAMTAFGVAFGIGVLLDRRRDLLVVIERRWPLFTVVAVLSGAAALYLVGGPVPHNMGPMTDPGMKIITASACAIADYAMTFASFALALRFASGHSAVRRYLADSSYWVYIVHVAVAMLVQVLVLTEPWPWYVKYLTVLTVATAVSLISYELLVRHTWLGRWINGRRVPRRAPAVDVAVPVK